jgi:hypothetical protein
VYETYTKMVFFLHVAEQNVLRNTKSFLYTDVAYCICLVFEENPPIERDYRPYRGDILRPPENRNRYALLRDRRKFGTKWLYRGVPAGARKKTTF